ncbi:SPOSA6832_04658 [Sporobolomyces salmonicolor]|uniref:SPOSA6832_04658-mRNA-1:cds n=1 Tax=Sporidiobolus salmonicolor TaxID=5005 RepID=A0A0D6ESK8_SPOSA|nr:SPOSA6832_04658 [Sporobolomyces salmonicolor]
MPVGPQLPPHLAAHASSSASIGPALPPSVSSGPAPPPPPSAPSAPRADSDSDDDFGPSLPPELVEARQKAAAIGPQLPPDLAVASASSSRRHSQSPPPLRNRPADDFDDDDFGPMPLPAGYLPATDENEGARLFKEREEREAERIRKAQEGQGKPQRDEWMLVPPQEMDLLSSMDPTKLKSRTFQTNPKAAAASSKSAKSSGPNLWTETPAERQQRLEDEALGRKRKAEEGLGGAAEEDDESDEVRRKRRRDAQLQAEVERHNKSTRSESLLDQHAKSSKSQKADDDDGKGPPGVWDRDRDMSLGGRLMDDGKRRDIIRNAKGLGGRFGGGGYL